MKSINTEIRRNYVLFGICLFLFIGFNVVITWNFVNQYAEYLYEYRQVNDIAMSYNESKTQFYLYIRQYEDEVKVKYEAANQDVMDILDAIEQDVKRDRNCLMMYRVVRQMLEYRQEKIDDYFHPTDMANFVSISYIDNLDLLMVNFQTKSPGKFPDKKSLHFWYLHAILLAKHIFFRMAASSGHAILTGQVSVFLIFPENSCFESKRRKAGASGKAGKPPAENRRCYEKAGRISCNVGIHEYR